ncbi:hypothetical protein BDV33DRAFT_207347 [Aspergillus novoparasiticus]|uniref:CipC protein n=1 Tax=Aspergillus novoparasiticus TaxID=986946 RepID=A0A5N6EHK6_9EURO|nr:hypothetical protein BDV33DRAFT_207347 [Aspergillus novoparasiticus]
MGYKLHAIPPLPSSIIRLVSVNKSIVLSQKKNLNKMGLLDYLQGQGHDEAYEQLKEAPHEARLSHELIAAAASYEAAKAYENHVAANGKPPSHEHAKELLAAVTGAFIDRTVETKGLDYIDAERAKSHAREDAQTALVESGEY